MPWVAMNLINNIIGNAPNVPQLLPRALDFFEANPLPATGIDPIAQGWNLLSQNLPDAAVRVMSVTANFPTTPASFEPLLGQLREQAREVGDIVTSTRNARQTFQDEYERSIASIVKRRTDLETTARQAGLLVTSVNAESVNALFDAEAERNDKESRNSWTWGIRVLVAAAAVAVLPLLLHYLGLGSDYSNGILLGTHIGATAALGAVAGVLLARSRA
jgi:hypothetical protein